MTSSSTVEYADQSIDLDKTPEQHPHATYFTYAEGYSMINAFIHPKALLLVDRDLAAVNGDIVVASVNGKYTVRRLRRNAHNCWLYPANSKYREMMITPEMNMTIWGVVIQIITNPRDIAQM